MSAPVASGWSVRRVGHSLHPLESAAFARTTPPVSDGAEAITRPVCPRAMRMQPGRDFAKVARSHVSNRMQTTGPYMNGKLCGANSNKVQR
jgi:hypothetical protein